MYNSANELTDLDYTRLPPAPHILIKLIDLFHKTDVSFEELEAIITKDTALCSKVISISSSAALCQWNDVRELKQILVILGTKTIKSIALTSAVHQFFSQFSKELGETLGSLWLDSLICAHLSKQLAKLTGYESPDEAHLAGLMHMLGQLIFLSNEPERYQSMMASASDQSALLYQEQENFGILSADLGADIISRWGIDSILHDAVRYQHRPADLLQDAHPLIKLTNLSSQLCNRLNHTNKKYLVEDHYFGLNQSVIENLVLQATKEAITDARSFGVDVDEDPTIPLANIDDEAIRIELARRVRQIALLEGIENNVSELDDISDMMKMVSENLQLLFGLSTTIFFFPDSNQSILTGIASHSKNLPASGSFIIKFKPQRSLVTESALQNSILNTRQQNIFTELTVIDHQIQDALMSPQFICLPLICSDQLMGVIAIGCDDQQIEKLNKDNELLCHFASIIASSLAHQQQLTHKHQQHLDIKQQEIEVHTRKIIHEVNNPLTIINNYLDILALDMEKDSKNKTHITTIKSEIDRVGEILLQLKDDQVVEFNDQPIVDINLIISKLVEIFKPTFYNLNNITSHVELDPALPLISTDQNKFKQVITNLLRNAAEAVAENGTIYIKTKARVIQNKKQYIEITISDDGPGIPEKVLNHLFSPIESTKGASHSGLGLTIVNKLVMELKGNISYSTSDQGGAQFIILLQRNQG